LLRVELLLPFLICLVNDHKIMIAPEVFERLTIVRGLELSSSLVERCTRTAVSCRG
jgi:hypothetical protein